MARRGRHNARPIQPGERFGRLVAVCETGAYYEPPGHRGRAPLVLCRCDCGIEKTITRGRLQAGRVNSCGCMPLGTHRMARTPIYRVWQAMKSRCQRVNDDGYHNYGGSGITVCERWQQFEAFYADMGDCPQGMSLDRIDNTRGYEPSNCRWATRKEQARNMRTNVWVAFAGETLTLAEWVERVGLSHETVRCRLKAGWSVADALQRPSIRKRTPLPNLIKTKKECNGQEDQ